MDIDYKSLIEKSAIQENGLTLGVTVSIGGTLTGDAETADSIVKRADHLLFQSKKKMAPTAVQSDKAYTRAIFSR